MVLFSVKNVGLLWLLSLKTIPRLYLAIFSENVRMGALSLHYLFSVKI